MRSIKILLALVFSVACVRGQITQPPEAVYVVYANEGATGTTINKLAKLTGAPSTAIISAITDTSGVVGVVVSGSATTGNAFIQVDGKSNCVFDGATTAGHYVQISSSVAGDCHDTGSATFPTSNQVIGRVTSTNGGGGTYTVDMSFKAPSASTGGGTGCVTTGTGVQTGDGAGGCTNNAGVTISSNNLAVTGGISSGSSPPSVTPGTGGVWAPAEGTAPSVCPAAGVDCVYANPTQHGLLADFNNGGYKPLVQGPTSATNGHLATFNGTNGGLLQDGGAVPTGTVTSVVMAGTANQITVTGTCTVTTSGTCTFSLPAGIILGTDASVAGSVQLANGAGGGAHTIWASGATTTNTIQGFATVPTTGHLVDCTVTSTTCLMHDSAVVTANVVQKVASGTVSLGTTTVNTGTCSSAIDGGTATGVLTTDTITATANADPTAVTGYTPATTGTLYVWAYPTADHVNFKLCNNTATNITPGSAVTLNWKVTR